MIYETATRPRARLIWALVLGAALSGCSAMQGVNVGASIPIGPVSVGASKRIEGSAPAPAPAPTPAPSQKKKTSEEKTSEQTDGSSADQQ